MPCFFPKKKIYSLAKVNERKVIVQQYFESYHKTIYENAKKNIILKIKLNTKATKSIYICPMTYLSQEQFFCFRISLRSLSKAFLVCNSLSFWFSMFNLLS